ncbi:MAG TPA: histone deacetylase [Methanoregulaceae archaeon]|nr:histone deacetylase [Methanoregulaceae archaeon]
MNFRCTAVTGDIFAKHEMDGHHDRNSRLKDAVLGIPPGVEIISPRPATVSDLERVHSPDYIQMIRDLCTGEEKRYIDMNTYLTGDTFEVASFAAGSAMTTVDQVLQGEHCFALVRPPGHHAEPDRAMGFCIFNNAAVAASYAVASGKKVAIIDWDIHHGNGTQKIFYSSDKVLYCSIHQANLFPGTGWIDEIGIGPGKGYTLNIPIRGGSMVTDYIYIFNHVIIPAIGRFLPDIVIISAGQDPLIDDPLGGMNLEPSDFGILTGLIADHFKNPLALVLEGGYGPSVRPSVHAIFSALQGEVPEYREVIPRESTLRVVSQLKKLIN